MNQANLIYSLVLGLLSFGAYQSSIYAGGQQATPEGKRLQRGLLILLAIQVVLFLITWVAWWGKLGIHTFLPVTDRTAAILSLVLIIWLWALPSLKPETDKLVLVVEAILLFAGALALVVWLRANPALVFIASPISNIAHSLSILLAVLGIAWLAWKRPESGGYGIAILVIFLIGYLFASAVRQPAGDYVWPIHIGEMVGFTILLMLPRRLVGQKDEPGISHKPAEAQSAWPAARLVQALAEVKNDASSPQYYLGLTRLLAHFTDAEQCLLIMPPKTGKQLIFPIGYSSPDERVIDAFTLDGRKMPLLLEAVQNGRPLQVAGSQPNAEAELVSAEIRLANASHILSIPFKKDETSPDMALLFMKSSTLPAWSEEDASQLSQLVKTLLTLARPAEAFSGQQAMQKEAENLRRAYAQLKAQYETLKLQADTAQVDTSKVADLLESQKSLQELVRYLESQNRELEMQAARNHPSVEEVEQLRAELQSALKDLARMPMTISKSDQQMLELQLSAVKQLDDMGSTETLRSIAQELRQPLSSIVGYTDVLLGESAGLLGAVQRKFLERIKAASERIGILANEMVQVLALEAGSLEQTQTQVNLHTMVDLAVSNLETQMGEKNIAMKIDMPEKLPSIQANQDVLQQIMANLLQNACLVTPANGEVKLFAQVEQKTGEPDYLHLSVTDQGGGIAQVDIPRIFSRRYKMENTPIKGIGDSGVGLSIVKSLVDLNKGRLWVDASQGSGSTISVLIPLNGPPQGK